MKKLPILFLFIVLVLNGYVSAQPEVDTTYNSNGTFVMNFVSFGTTGDVITQPDNKILLIASCVANFSFHSFCIMRANANGGFDTSFGGTGYIATNLSGTGASSGMTGLALQSDGKIIAAGGASSKLAIVRFNSDGGLDSSFGTGGFVLGTIAGLDQAQKVLVQPDGKILVLVASGASDSAAQHVTRYLSNGTIDDSFGTSGFVTLSTVSYFLGSTMSLQPDGKIVVGGAARVTRLNADGSLDTTFDGDGVVNIASGSNIMAVDVQSDGKILALGYNNILYRFNTNGSPDTSFDGDGSRQALNGTSDSFDLLVTPSGKINVGGNPTVNEANFPNIFFRYARYLPDGSPDATFSDDGYLDVNFTSYTVEGVTALTIDRQGRLVAGGRASSGSILRAPWNTPQFATNRLLASPSQNVGFSGRVAETNGKAVANAYLTLKNGSETIGYARTNPFGYFHFANIPSAQTYTLSTTGKNLTFYDRSVLVDGAIENFSVVGF